jgi:hypothetical protein
MTDGPASTDFRFGPNTAEVERAIDLARVGAGATMWFFSTHYEREFLEARPLWDQATAVAEANGLADAYQRAYDEGYEAGYSATGCAWEDSTYASGFAAKALVVRHLLDPDVFERLYHRWGEVFGPPSAATVEQEPPDWPPAIAFGPDCGSGRCLHGAALRQRRPKATDTPVAGADPEVREAVPAAAQRPSPRRSPEPAPERNAVDRAFVALVPVLILALLAVIWVLTRQ